MLIHEFNLKFLGIPNDIYGSMLLTSFLPLDDDVSKSFTDIFAKIDRPYKITVF